MLTWPSLYIGFSPSPTFPVTGVPSYRKPSWGYSHEYPGTSGAHRYYWAVHSGPPNFLYSPSTWYPPFSQVSLYRKMPAEVFALLGAATAQGRDAPAPVQQQAGSSCKPICVGWEKVRSEVGTALGLNFFTTRAGHMVFEGIVA